MVTALFTAFVNRTASAGALKPFAWGQNGPANGLGLMLFLLNDVVFDLDEACPAPSHDVRRFENLSFDYVLEMGCELFAEEPLLHQTDPARARRLAWLIAHRAEGVNAALFAAPQAGCAPELVEPRFCALPEVVLRHLQQRARRRALNAVAADKAVWSRLAA